MNIPTYKKKKRIKFKICHESGCGKEFWGHPIAKYCELHRDIKQRVKIKKHIENANEKNICFKHIYVDSIDIEFICGLKDCSHKYTVKVFQKQYVYPKYCQEHRNDFKRENYLRLMNKSLKVMNISL